jgi:hypothetical protein
MKYTPAVDNYVSRRGWKNIHRFLLKETFQVEAWQVALSPSNILHGSIYCLPRELESSP